MSLLLAGITLGFSAGISPGPLTTLVLTTTLERGFGAGLRVAVAPLITDLPIIVIALLLLNALPLVVEIALTAGGGLLLCYLGVETLRAARHAAVDALVVESGGSRDLLRGAMVNALSPHPWLFWLGVCGPLMVGAWRSQDAVAAFFLIGFYALLVGTKIALAWIVARGRALLTDTWYRRLLVASGGLLILLGLLLFAEAAQRLL